MTKNQVFHKNRNFSETIRPTQDATKQLNKLNTKALQGAPGRDDTEGFTFRKTWENLGTLKKGKKKVMKY